MAIDGARIALPCACRLEQRSRSGSNSGRAFRNPRLVEEKRVGRKNAPFIRIALASRI